MKPDLRATKFSPQNAFFFASLSKMAYKPKNEAMGLVKGNSTFEGVGFDSFYWFEVRFIRSRLDQKKIHHGVEDKIHRMIHSRSVA